MSGPDLSARAAARRPVQPHAAGPKTRPPEARIAFPEAVPARRGRVDLNDVYGNDAVGSARPAGWSWTGVVPSRVFERHQPVDSDLSALLAKELPLGILTDIVAHALGLPTDLKQLLLAEATGVAAGRQPAHHSPTNPRKTTPTPKTAVRSRFRRRSASIDRTTSLRNSLRRSRIMATVPWKEPANPWS